MPLTAAQQAAKLRTRRDAILTELAALTTSGAGGLPNASGDGVTVDHVGYKDGLYRELAEIEKLLRSLPGVSGDGGGYGVVEHRGY